MQFKSPLTDLRLCYRPHNDQKPRFSQGVEWSRSAHKSMINLGWKGRRRAFGLSSTFHPRRWTCKTGTLWFQRKAHLQANSSRPLWLKFSISLLDLNQCFPFGFLFVKDWFRFLKERLSIRNSSFSPIKTWSGLQLSWIISHKKRSKKKYSLHDFRILISILATWKGGTLNERGDQGRIQYICLFRTSEERKLV